MVPWPSNVLPAHIRDETYLLGGILRPANARRYSKLPLQPILTGTAYRWLYSLFLAIDANFRLKLKSRAIKDPELGPGLAYFVDSVKFQKHLVNSVREDEVIPSTIPTLGSAYHCNRSKPAVLSSTR